jgi:uncharacterized protein YoxC
MTAWQATVAALSLLVIALSFLAIAVAVFLASRKAAVEARQLSQTLAALQQDLRPVLGSVKGVTDAGQEMTDLVRREVEGFAATSMRIRNTADTAVNTLADRARDLDAIYEVLYHEIEETALDLGTVLRRTRRPKGLLGRIKRLIGA